MAICETCSNEFTPKRHTRGRFCSYECFRNSDYEPWNKGKKDVYSDEMLKKMSEVKKGRIPWNLGIPHSDETKRKIKEKRAFQEFSEETRRKLSVARKGKTFTKEHRHKISSALKGEKSPNWKGGITPLMMKIRNQLQCREWRKSTFVRDDYTCRKCGKRGSTILNAHHIIPFSVIVEKNNITTLEQAIDTVELWDVNNGITLCINCHKLEHNNIEEQT